MDSRRDPLGEERGVHIGCTWFSVAVIRAAAKLLGFNLLTDDELAAIRSRAEVVTSLPRASRAIYVSSTLDTILSSEGNK